MYTKSWTIKGVSSHHPALCMYFYALFTGFLVPSRPNTQLPFHEKCTRCYYPIFSACLHIRMFVLFIPIAISHTSKSEIKFIYNIK